MLTHYIIVRRDLSVGVIAAMVTHAAGESIGEWTRGNPERNVLPGNTTAVVLETKDETHLSEIHQWLLPMRPTIGSKLITDEDPLTRQVHRFAIGVYPIQRAVGDVLFKELQTLKTCLDRGDVNA